MWKLGDLVLPDCIQWTDQHDWQPVAQDVVRTLSGSQVIFCAALIGGRPITLEVKDGDGWIDQTTLDALKIMASQLGFIASLVWDNETIQVIFRHQEPPALSAIPIWPGDDRYTCQIKLMSL